MKTSWYLTVLRHSSWNTTRASDHSLRVHDLFIWSLRKRMQCRRSTLCTSTSCELLRRMSNAKIHNSEWRRKNERLQLLEEMGNAAFVGSSAKCTFKGGVGPRNREIFGDFLAKPKGGVFESWNLRHFWRGSPTAKFKNLRFDEIRAKKGSILPSEKSYFSLDFDQNCLKM